MEQSRHDERAARWADIKLRDAEFDKLLLDSMGETIPSAECRNEYLYWGLGRSIGEMAICTGPNNNGEMQFKGLRNKFGIDFLFTELHYDDNNTLGTWRPLLELCMSPIFDTEEQCMYWLLDQEIDTAQSHITWLHSMPKRLKQAPSYGIVLDQSIDHLEIMQNTKHNGFSDTPHLTYKQLMAGKITK